MQWFRSGKVAQLNGRVKFYNRKKGYGFIESEAMGNDIFVHASNLEDDIRKGDRVTFFLKKNPKGLEAKDVRIIG